MAVHITNLQGKHMTTNFDATPNGVSSIVGTHTHGTTTFTVELSTDNDAVTYELRRTIEHVAATNKPVVMPQPRELHPAVCNALVTLIDRWFDKCPWELVSLRLVRELNRLRSEFHGVWNESQ